MVNEELKEGDKFRHYKGGLYVIICEATCVKLRETQVVYRSLSDGKIYCRDKVEFLDTVNINRPERVSRFERIEEQTSGSQS